MRLLTALWLIAGCSDYELVTDNDPAVPGIGPLLDVQPTAIDFGALEVGQTLSEVVTVQNLGDGPLTLDPLTLADPSGSFTLEPLDRSALEAGESTDFLVTFAPHEALVVSGEVTVASPDAEPEAIQVLLDGEGAPPPTHSVELLITADDAWTGWLDGVELAPANADYWPHSDTFTLTLPAGEHVLAVHATDASSVTSGLIAVIRVDGVVTTVTGDGSWSMSSTAPPSDWTQAAFDDSAWAEAAICANQGTWGTYWPVPFYDAGAQWVWWSQNCQDLQQAWFRLRFSL